MLPEIDANNVLASMQRLPPSFAPRDGSSVELREDVWLHLAGPAVAP